MFNNRLLKNHCTRNYVWKNISIFALFSKIFLCEENLTWAFNSNRWILFISKTYPSIIFLHLYYHLLIKLPFYVSLQEMHYTQVTIMDYEPIVFCQREGDFAWFNCCYKPVWLAQGSTKGCLWNRKSMIECVLQRPFTAFSFSNSYTLLFIEFWFWLADPYL